MKTISYKLKDLDQKEKKVTLKLGYVGENEHVQIRIDCSEIWENYPNAVASLAVEPPEGSKYPAIVTREGNVVCWTVKDSDVVHDGDGRIQLTFTEGSEIQKTVICRTKVDESIIGSGTAPDPIADFVAEANEALAELEAAEVHGPVIGEDGYWYTWSKDAGEYVKTDTKVQGEDGQQGPAGKDGKDGKDGADGAPGQDGHTPVKGTDYWTQQDQADIVAAAALETVSAVIDDTAGDGDTNKTWSADKIAEETGLLLNAIDGKAPAIVDGEISYSHKNVDSFIINGNDYAFGNARYADQKDLIEGYDRSFVIGSGGNAVSIDVHGNVAIINGIRSSGGDDQTLWDLPVDMPAGKYTFKIEPYVGESTLSNGKNMHLLIWYDGNETATRDVQVSLWTVKDTATASTFTTTDHAYKIRVITGIANNTYDDYRLFFSLFPYGTNITDTGEVLEEGEELEITPSDVMAVLDTMMHKSTVQVIVDTKQYIDSQTPEGMLTKKDIVYLSPEMFGAKGDGISNDTNAIADCLAASKISDEVYIPVKGYGQYLVTSPVIITGKYANVYLHKIIYTGSDVAVKVSGTNNVFQFDYIYALSSNTAMGLKIDATGSIGFNSCELSCGRIRSMSNCIYIESVQNKVISYNVLRFGMLSSTLGDIFHFNVQEQCNENDFYGKYVLAQNGHFATTDNISQRPTATFHQFCIESDVKYGIKNIYARLIDCRTDEFMALSGDISDSKKGVLFDFDGMKAESCFANILTPVNFDSIDVSGAMSFDDLLEEVTERFNALPQDATSEERHRVLVQLCHFKSVFEKTNALKPYTLIKLPSGSIISFLNKKAFKPDGEFYYKPTTDDFNTEEVFPTFIDISDVNEATVNIYLCDSYCWPGINKFKLKQYSGIKAKVYDKNSNLIFDGTNEDAGVYEFECSFERLSGLTLDLDGGGTYTVPAIYVNTIYTGDNEVWHIYKKTEIDN